MRELLKGLRELLIAALQTTLSLANTETPQSIYILGGVVAPPVRASTSKWESAQPLSEPKPSGGYAKLVCCLADSECARLLNHARIVSL
jgi:hypothetical protein